MKLTIRHTRKERGATIVTVMLMLCLLLGFMGIALDFGHLFVIRSEVQTAMDACALAAAQELDGEADSVTRATNAGITAANANAVDLQSDNWKGQNTSIEFSFYNDSHNPPASPAAARYARCTHTQATTATPLLRLASYAPGSAGAPATMDVGAFAEATTAPSQSVCPVPLAFVPDPKNPPKVGDWVTLLNGKTKPTPPYIGWANLDGSTNAKETVDELQGHCGTRLGDTLGTPGSQSALIAPWNTRFGLYKNKGDPVTSPPDFTGYIYTSTSWAPGRDAYNDFVSKRQSFANCGASIDVCESSNGYKKGALSTGSSYLSTSGTGGDLQTYGTNRRLVSVPIMDGTSQKVTGFACMLILEPLSSPWGMSSWNIEGILPTLAAHARPTDCLVARPGHGCPCSCVEEKAMKRHSRKGQQGVALVEFALILPMLLILTFMTTELGRAYYQYDTITKGVREAARYLSVRAAGVDEDKAKNIVVYGNPTPDSSASPLVNGLTKDMVSIPARTLAGTYPRINTLTVTVSGYTFVPMVSSVFGFAFTNITFGPIHATMRSPT